VRHGADGRSEAVDHRLREFALLVEAFNQEMAIVGHLAFPLVSGSAHTPARQSVYDPPPTTLTCKPPILASIAVSPVAPCGLVGWS
jgi:hypothetical protein